MRDRRLISWSRTSLKRSVAWVLAFAPVAMGPFAAAGNSRHKPSICEVALQTRDPRLLRVVESLAKGREPTPDSGVFARILRGKAEKDFEALSTDPGRKIILLMDASGLKATFSPASSTPPLERIGYTRGYIEELRSFGQKFKVALLRPKGLVARATWDNLLLFLVEAYGVGHPVVQAFKVHLPALKQYSFVQILQKFGRGINPAINSNTMPPQGNLLEVRSFLYNELRLTDLFTGDGYTRTPDGGLGIAEYFFLNREFKKMYRHEYEIADIHF